jgi:preprotein translocase subunit SecE
VQKSCQPGADVAGVWFHENQSGYDMKEKIIGFFTDVVKEMNKVTWPKKEELRESTIVVLVVCVVIAAFVYAVDTVVSEVLRQIL